VAALPFAVTIDLIEVFGLQLRGVERLSSRAERTRRCFLIPHGSVHAVSAAEILLPESLPEPGRIAQRPEARPEKSQKQSDFSKRLDREVERRERPERKAPEERIRNIREEEQTKESALARKQNEPKAVLNHQERREAVKKTEPGKDTEVVQAPVKNEEDIGAQVDPQKARLDLLLAALEDWIAGLLEAKTGADGGGNQGPGGSEKLSGDTFGPRFVIEAPAAFSVARETGEGTDPSAILRMLSPEKGEISESRISDDPAKMFNTGGEVDLKGTKGQTFDLPGDLTRGERFSQFIQQRVLSGVDGNRQGETSNEAARNAGGKVSAELIDQPVIKNDPKLDPLWKILKNEQASSRTSPAKADIEGIDKIDITRYERESVLARLAELMSKSEVASRQKPGLPGYSQNQATAEQPSAFRAGLEGLLSQPLSDLSQAGKSQAAPRPDVSIIVEDVKQAVEDFGKGSLTTVRLRLHPPELGQLVVEFRRDDNGLRIEFHTPNPAVLKAIQDAGPKMIEKLAESGIDLGSLDVFLSNGNEQGDKSYSPLDNPDRGLVVNDAGFSDELNSGDTAGNEVARVMYLSNRDSTVDLMI
jgi:hypothetical protein